MKCIVIAGMPASGKSTVARYLNRTFQFPILEKDAIKEELFDTLGFQCYAEKRRMDVAATAVLLRMLEDMLACGQSVIVVNNFRDDAKVRLKGILQRYRTETAVVFLGGDGNEFYRRYVERDENPTRHLGHVLQNRFPPAPEDPKTYTMTREEFAAKFEQLGMDHLGLLENEIWVDATAERGIDLEALTRQIQNELNKQMK